MYSICPFLETQGVSWGGKEEEKKKILVFYFAKTVSILNSNIV